MTRLFQRFACLFGHHKRSRRAASLHGANPTSRCRGCGVPMTKVAGEWRMAGPGEAAG